LSSYSTTRIKSGMEKRERADARWPQACSSADGSGSGRGGAALGFSQASTTPDG